MKRFGCKQHKGHRGMVKIFTNFCQILQSTNRIEQGVVREIIIFKKFYALKRCKISKFFVSKFTY